METMFMQNFGGQTKSIMVFLKVAYSNTTKQNNAALKRGAWGQFYKSFTLVIYKCRYCFQQGRH